MQQVASNRGRNNVAVAACIMSIVVKKIDVVGSGMVRGVVGAEVVGAGVVGAVQRGGRNSRCGSGGCVGSGVVGARVVGEQPLLVVGARGASVMCVGVVGAGFVGAGVRASKAKRWHCTTATLLSVLSKEQ